MSEFRKLVRSDRVREGRIAIGRYGVRQVAVVRQRGALFAFKNTCPHAGAPLSGGTLGPDCITCPRHAWRFRLSDGACDESEMYSLSLYEAREVDGWIEVRPLAEEIW